MRSETTSENVRNFIEENLMRDTGTARLEPEDNLIELGIIDSLGIQKLIGFLESSFSIEISDEELLPENFETVTAICSFVNGKMNNANV